MSEEPTYHFVRGTGWVPRDVSHEIETRQIGPYTMTLERRHPLHGERFWFVMAGDTFDELFKVALDDFTTYGDAPSGAEYNDTWDRGDGETLTTQIDRDMTVVTVRVTES